MKEVYLIVKNNVANGEIARFDPIYTSSVADDFENARAKRGQISMNECLTTLKQSIKIV